MLPTDSTQPDWALADATAALKIGMTVPQVEQRLIAKGLSQAAATAVVNKILEGHLQVAQLPIASEKSLTMHRAVSALVACVCLGLGYWYGGGISAARTLLWMLLPMACIWWAEVMEASLPPAMIRWAAWLALIAIGMYRVVLLTL